MLRFIVQESRSRATGRQFTDRLIWKCRELSKLPGQMGRPRSELGDGIRRSAFQGYVVIFRYVGDTFEVVRIFEGHRDIDAHFGDDN
ncbi:type II toxin-antitoxin system RelE/ParE family toxin [Rhizobium binxianense]